MLAFRSTILASLVLRYFYSGWAFLIPYLAAYLLYYTTGWPVNPANPVGETAPASALTPLTAYSSYLPVPSLLHLYWALHLIHLALAALALRNWWTENSAQCVGSPSDSQSAPYFSYRLHLLTRIAPWAILALIFYIPGVYLEWPSDPWEHLRRINEWRSIGTVGAHSSWHKSAYFIPYSVLSWCMGLRQLFWLDFYYTGICLLLCWQYYRLARACGLGERASMVFVIAQALLFGNNIFSFYRYYGISSSIYAQLGAVALTRIVLEWAARGTKLAPTLQEETTTIGNDAGTPLAPGSPTASHSFAPSPVNYSFYSLLATRYSLLPISSRPSVWHLPSLFSLLAAGACLLALIIVNHIQGVAIAGIGSAAVVTWRLIESKRTAILWLFTGTLAFNALSLTVHTRPEIIEAYRAQGWLNEWYGVNIFDLSSPAGDRMIQIVTIFGLINLVAAAILLSKNHIIAWLTCTPFIILLQPCVSIPFSYALSKHGDPSNIVTFQRMFFTAPPALALIAYWSFPFIKKTGKTIPLIVKRQNKPSFAFACLLILTLIIITSTAKYTSSRLWHTLFVTPSDLKLINVIAEFQKDPALEPTIRPTISNQTGAALRCFSPEVTITALSRIIALPATLPMRSTLEFLGVDTTATASTNYRNQAPNLIGHELYTHNLIADPKTKIPSAWTSLGGHPPKFVSGIADLDSTSTALSNPAGLTSLPFTKALIPIQRTKSYRVEMTIRHLAMSSGTAYLAVAWYDKDRNLLTADQPLDRGGGNPYGWTNGTYSYFGLLSQPPPADWTKFQKTFGLNEGAAIPAKARFVRLGALLNNNGTQSSTMYLTDIGLYEKETPPIDLIAPSPTTTYSPTSTAGLTSHHWPQQQVNIDNGGSIEIRTAMPLQWPPEKK